LLAASVASSCLRKRPVSWRIEPPTAEQVGYAGALGIPVRDGITSGELADRIQQEKRSRRDDD